MKKIFTVIIACIMAAAMLSACSNTGSALQTPTGPTGKDTGTANGSNKGITTNKISFTEPGDGELPGNAAKNLDAIKAVRGYAFFKVDDGFIVILSSGEKKTGGYTIKVMSVEDIEGVTKIVAEENAPAKDAMVTQAITYPYTAIKITAVPERFEVVNQNGEKFDVISLENTGNDKLGTREHPYTDIKGTFNGQIDNNFIEMKTDEPVPGIDWSNGPMSFMLNEQMKDYFLSSSKSFKNIKEGDKVVFSFYMNENGQLPLTSLEKAK